MGLQVDLNMWLQTDHAHPKSDLHIDLSAYEWHRITCCIVHKRAWVVPMSGRQLSETDYDNGTRNISILFNCFDAYPKTSFKDLYSMRVIGSEE